MQVVPRKLRQSLEGLIEQMKSMPNWTRHYAAYDYLHAILKSYLKANALVSVLVGVRCCIGRHPLNLRCIAGSGAAQ